MADHLQNQLLDFIAATIAAAGTDAGANVFLDRVDEIPTTRLPAVLIEGIGDIRVDAVTFDFPPAQERTYALAITSVVHHVSGAGRNARNLAGQVEAALLASSVVAGAGGLANGPMRLQPGQEIRDGAGDVNLYGVRQVWHAGYVTAAGRPDAVF